MPGSNRITYYDFADLNHSSFFQAGFVKSQSEYGYKLVVRRDTPDILKGKADDIQWQKNLFAISLFEASFDDDRFYFCIDTHDSSTLDSGYNLKVLEQVRYYFKANYRASAIAEDPVLQSHAHKIIPTTPFFPIRVPGLFRYWPRLLPNADTGWSYNSVKTRIRRLHALLSLREIKNLRAQTKDIDVFFVLAHYSQQHHSNVSKTRYELVDKLVGHPRIKAVAGLITNKELPRDLAHLKIKRFDQKTYLQFLSRAKLAIYVRGPHECLSYKFAELLALGKPIVGQKIINNDNLLYSYANFTEQFDYENTEAIIERIDELLCNSDELKALQESNSQIFDKYLTPRVSVSHMLMRIMRQEQKSMTMRRVVGI